MEDQYLTNSTQPTKLLPFPSRFSIAALQPVLGTKRCVRRRVSWQVKCLGDLPRERQRQKHPSLTALSGVIWSVQSLITATVHSAKQLRPSNYSDAGEGRKGWAAKGMRQGERGAGSPRAQQVQRERGERKRHAVHTRQTGRRDSEQQIRA